ncbi:hypothetical protein PCO31110_01731 [Pandoraea communis]|uniref:Uncharacterized protein n=1 Tax=Pandoraea communis TaxID=2508297 RepID=A0A5E4TYX8_9BURK|nr:hypothetical protein PCO31110_01731 [Pandoraea communis]
MIAKSGAQNFPHRTPSRPTLVHNLYTAGTWRARRRRHVTLPEAKAVTAKRVFGSIRSDYANFT